MRGGLSSTIPQRSFIIMSWSGRDGNKALWGRFWQLSWGCLALTRDNSAVGRLIWSEPLDVIRSVIFDNLLMEILGLWYYHAHWMINAKFCYGWEALSYLKYLWQEQTSFYPPQVIYVTELLANLILGEQESLARQAIIIKLTIIIKTIFIISLLFAVFTFYDNKYFIYTKYNITVTFKRLPSGSFTKVAPLSKDPESCQDWRRWLRGRRWVFRFLVISLQNWYCFPGWLWLHQCKRWSQIESNICWYKIQF